MHTDCVVCLEGNKIASPEIFVEKFIQIQRENFGS
jgi:hypothetical protein